MNVAVVILVGVIAAGIGFLLGGWLAPLLRSRNNSAVPPPVMNRREVDKLRETVTAMEAQIERLERHVKDPSFRQNQVR